MAAALVVAAVALGLFTYVLSTKNAQLEQAYLAESQQRAQAVERLALARELTGELYSKVTEKLLLTEPAMEDVQEQFLRKSLQFLERFAEQDEQGPSGRRERAYALNRIGIAYGKLGQSDRADTAFAQATELYRRNLRDEPDNETDRAGLALSCHCRAQGRATSQQSESPESLIREAISLRQKLVEDFPAKVEYRGDLALSIVKLGMLTYDARRHDEAEALVRQAIASYEELYGPARTPDQANTLAGFLHSLATIRLAQRQGADAITLLQRAIDLDLAVVSEMPRTRRPREFLANHYSRKATAHAEAGQFAEAEQSIRQCIAHRERLVQDFPKTALYRSVLADNRWVLASILTAAMRPEAEAACQQAVANYEDLVRTMPGRRGNLAQAYDTLGQYLGRSDKLDEAAAALTRSLDIHKGKPDSMEFSACLCNLGIVRWQQGNLPEAVRLTEQALSIVRSQMRAEKYAAEARRFFPIQCAALAQFLSEMPAPARDLNRAAALAREGLALDPNHADCRHTLGQVLYRSGEAVAAIIELERAMPNVKTDTNRIGLWFYLTMAYCEAGDALKGALYLAAATASLESREMTGTQRRRLSAHRKEAAAALGVIVSDTEIRRQ